MSDDAPHDLEDFTTTRLGENGELTIPKEHVENLGLEPGSTVAVLQVGPGLVVVSDQKRIEGLFDRIVERLSESGSKKDDLLGGVAAILASEETIIVNHQKILANEEKIRTK